MSTRDEILAALTEATAGLTSKELAPLCPAADCDPMIVGRVVALLRSENVIHPGDELREGGTIWLFGGEKVEEVVEHVGLHDFNRRQQSDHISEAARAISDMRRPPSTARRAPDRAPTPVTTPAPARAVDSPKEQPMSSTRDRIEAALKAHGPMDARTLRKHVRDENLPAQLSSLCKREVICKLGGGPKSTIYGLPGQALKDAKREDATAPPQRVPPKKVNGSANDAYTAALTSLQEKRAVLADELAKVDRAIEAVGALA